jgi:type IV pilus assembly protein PilY1
MRTDMLVPIVSQLMLIGLLFGMAGADPSHAASRIPEVNIASGPLSGGGNIHPNMVLSLSVNFPMAGAAYRADGGSYDRTYEYIGYFNPLKCYRYQGGNRNISDGYFAVAEDADALHECGGDTFSGNFLNWAALSTIDVLRYALTGGDRIVDTTTRTILQRAVLGKDFYANDVYFPRRIVTGGGNVSAPDRVTPFRVDTLFIVSCGNRILFSDSANKGNDCDTRAFGNNGALAKSDKKLGEYLVRVEVCDRNEGISRTGLCQRYGANFKPVGEMQRHAEKIRFAAMGYLLDDSENRYGGVLRAPMKYIGAKKFAEPGFTASANEYLEWDPATGVLYGNPDEKDNRTSKVSNSGIINYLNKFGRTGNYKTLDPVSELYYEGLRYLQGKAATPDATRGMSEAMKDGFPVLGNWKDPITASCQRNYIVSIAGAETDWDRYIPGNDRATFNRTGNAHDTARPVEMAVADKTPALDVKPWTRRAGDMEADISGLYANPSPRPHLRGLENLDTGFAGQGSYYMSGLAYWANTNDIRLDKPVRVKTFTIDVDEGGNGLIDGSSRTVNPRDSQLYLAAKYGGFDDANGDGNPFVTFGPDDRVAIKSSNVEWDRNGTGIPANYFLAHHPRELVSSIRKIFSTVAGTVGTSSGMAVSATKVVADRTFAYQAGFASARWSGSLKKFAVTTDDAGAIKIAKTPDWDAADILTGTSGKAAFPGPGNRSIYTARYNSTNSLVTVPFKWSELADNQRASLNLSPVNSSVDGLGEKRLNYLRGERNLELDKQAGIFRVRDSVLGDIVNSSPVYVGAPVPAAQGDGYHKFFEANKNRTEAVYVGANDGMLHAFNAADGTELFSYIPNALLSRLHHLTAPDYSHQPYMDGALTVSDALVSGDWKTVLAAGMGGGAQGVFALDVSNPSNFSGGSGALWEFTDHDDPDIGNLFGAPIIAKFKTKVTKGTSEYKYFVVVPSGLNHYKEDGAGKFSETGQGALFLLSLDKVPAAKWESGVNFFKIKMPMPDSASQNGLAPPALVVGNDGAVRYAYAGDLQGNLWRFDFTGVSPWTGALGTPPAKPLFVARDAQGARQPITTQPRVVFAPGGGYVVLFGTGKFVEDADTAPGNFKTQSFYGILDTGSQAYRVSGRDDLAPRLLSKISVNGNEAIGITGADFSYGVADRNKKGWVFDFPASDKTGERLVVSPLIANRNLIFNTLIPGNDPCSAGGGRSYFLSALTGLASYGKPTGYLSESGLLNIPLLLESAAEVGNRDPIGRRTVRKRVTIFNSGKDDGKGTIVESPGGRGEFKLPAGRLSWREIINWQELRDAAKNK